jgi:integrase
MTPARSVTSLTIWNFVENSSGFFKMLRRTAEGIGLRGVHPHILRHGLRVQARE